MPGTVLDFVGTLMDKAGTSLSLECLQHACAYRTTAVQESKAVSWPGGPPSKALEPGSWLRYEHVPFALCRFSLWEQHHVAAGSGNGSHQGPFPVLSHQRGMREHPRGREHPP